MPSLIHFSVWDKIARTQPGALFNFKLWSLDKASLLRCKAMLPRIVLLAKQSCKVISISLSNPTSSKSNTATWIETFTRVIMGESMAKVSLVVVLGTLQGIAIITIPSSCTKHRLVKHLKDNYYFLNSSCLSLINSKHNNNRDGLTRRGCEVSIGL